MITAKIKDNKKTISQLLSLKNIFNPIMQFAYVVPDLTSAIKHWNGLGVGPFHVFPHLELKSVKYLGQDTDIDFSMAITYSGDVQIELVQQHNNAPSIYCDFLKKFPSGGQQHVAVVSKHYLNDLTILKDVGIKPVQEVVTLSDKQACYVNTDFHPGGMIEIIEYDDGMMSLFKMIKNSADFWDGVQGDVYY